MPYGVVTWVDLSAGETGVRRRRRQYVARVADVEPRVRRVGAPVHFDIRRDEGAETAIDVRFWCGMRTSRHLAEIPAPSARPRTRSLVTDRNGLEVLDEATCLALLSDSPLGRIAYTAAGAARVVPVNIAVVDGAVLFRVGTGGLLAAIADRQLLTLECDHIDADSDGGWSVIVTGPAREVARHPDRSQPAVCSWLRPDAARLVRLTPLEISGRRLPAAGGAPASMPPAPMRGLPAGKQGAVEHDRDPLRAPRSDFVAPHLRTFASRRGRPSPLESLR